MMKREIKIRAIYHCSPLRDEDDAVDIDPEELPISDDLRKDLDRWAEAYDATLNQDYPPDTSGVSTETKRSLHEDGLRLQAELQKQLGDDCYVGYRSPFPDPEG